MIEETKRLFRPEFINRLDEVVVFHSLSKDNILKIVDICMDEIQESAEERKIKITLSPKAKSFIADRGYKPEYGARQVKRTLRKFIEDPLAEELLRGNFADGSHILVDEVKDELKFSLLKSEPVDEKDEIVDSAPVKPEK